ncbi:MAG: ABC-F family ATP-binding cassette domain-containing protein [Paludibacteraceae bacterium]|nr:ABC-F family ATP-binding cassette domain-containing protein [Paludibacteraceae bacterium]
MPIPYLLVEDLKKTIGDKTLFSNISFAVNKGEKIALIARNGIGKSTLLNILMDDFMGKSHDFDSGKITWRRDLKVHYLPQQIDYPTEWATLSGGQKKKRLLDRVLDDEPDMIIMDEPTNHLDLSTVVWLEQQLCKSQVTLLMVTHDRYFLDCVCTDILELDQRQIFSYHGNYSYYLEKRAERIEQQNAETAKARNLYRTELDWMRRMPQARAHKAQYRIDNFYELEKRAKRTIEDDSVRLTMRSGYIGNKIFEGKDVCKAFGEQVILNHFSYVFSRYEKLGIIGNNGTGKSTFLRLLLGEIQPDSGYFDVGSTVRFGYYRQTGLPFASGKKVIDLVRDVAETIDLGNGERLTAGQFLQHFLFTPSQQYDYIDKLSGGEKQRLHLCMVLMRNPNFLILDEPTNDLDIQTLQVLEEYLMNFHGCLIVVSHDRYFMDKVVDHLFVFRGQGTIDDFPGNYTQFRASEQSTNTEQSGISNHKSSTTNLKSKTTYQSSHPRRLTFREKQELAQLEQQLPQLEQEKRDLETALSGVLTVQDEIIRASARYQQLMAELDAAELRWLELNEIPS